MTVDYSSNIWTDLRAHLSLSQMFFLSLCFPYSSSRLGGSRWLAEPGVWLGGKCRYSGWATNQASSGGEGKGHMYGCIVWSWQTPNNPTSSGKTRSHCVRATKGLTWGRNAKLLSPVTCCPVGFFSNVFNPLKKSNFHKKKRTLNTVFFVLFFYT